MNNFHVVEQKTDERITSLEFYITKTPDTLLCQMERILQCDIRSIYHSINGHKWDHIFIVETPDNLRDMLILLRSNGYRDVTYRGTSHSSLKWKNYQIDDKLQTIGYNNKKNYAEYINAERIEFAKLLDDYLINHEDIRFMKSGRDFNTIQFV